MTLAAYIATVDDSDPWATSREDTHFLAGVAHDHGCMSILELGSFRGVTAAALAIANPQATVTAVDDGYRVTDEERLRFWGTLGLHNIMSVTAKVYPFLHTCPAFDFVFHDAGHGSGAIPEYKLAWYKTRKVLAVHDWDMITEVERGAMLKEWSPARVSTRVDGRGRITLIAVR